MKLIGEYSDEFNVSASIQLIPESIKRALIKECIDEMIALFGKTAVMNFCACNVYKYRYRAAAKNGQEDLDKANWYMDKLMELEGKEQV